MQFSNSLHALIRWDLWHIVVTYTNTEQKCPENNTEEDIFWIVVQCSTASEPRDDFHLHHYKNIKSHNTS